MGSPAGASWKSCIISPRGLSSMTSHGGRLRVWVALLAFCCDHVFCCCRLIAADYQTQSLAEQKSSASFLANCTLSVASSAWTESVHILTTGSTKHGTHCSSFSLTSSRLHRSCISPSICSTNSSVNRIYARRTAGSNTCAKYFIFTLIRIDGNLEPGPVGCVRMLFGSERSFHPRGHKSDGRVAVDAFVSEVSAVEQPTPAGDRHGGLWPLVQCFWWREEKRDYFAKGGRTEQKGGRQYRRQRGSSVPDSWLNFKWTLSSCRVRTSSCGTMAAELSLSKLSFRLLRKQGRKRRKVTVSRSYNGTRNVARANACRGQTDNRESTWRRHCRGLPWVTLWAEVTALLRGRNTYWGLSWLCLWLLMGGSAALLLNSSPFLKVSLICSVSVNTPRAA